MGFCYSEMADFDRGVDTYPSAGGVPESAPQPAKPHWDISYITTIPGILKAAQVVSLVVPDSFFISVICHAVMVII